MSSALYGTNMVIASAGVESLGTQQGSEIHNESAFAYSRPPRVLRGTLEIGSHPRSGLSGTWQATARQSDACKSKQGDGE